MKTVSLILMQVDIPCDGTKTCKTKDIEMFWRHFLSERLACVLILNRLQQAEHEYN